MTKTIAVIDGNSLMHRAYHAIQTPMAALDGTPTNAVFGFMQMFCKFVETTAPDAVVCAFDAGKPTERIAELPEYKAQRPHMDDELRVQFPVIEELLGAMDVPVVKVPGWEGDDILGTVAARDEKLGFKTLVVTGDKDACQLASELTSIVNTKKGISDIVVLDPAGVEEKYGVTPAQFTDYLGLMGDTSDNIPGVPGVGPKTAMTMLQKFGDMEHVYENLDEFTAKQRQKLEENKDLAFLSRQIATIVRDLDFELDLEGIAFPSFSEQSVSAAFKKYSLMSPLTRVLRFVDSTPAIERVDIDPGERVSAEDWQRLLDAAIDADEEVGFAFATGEQDTIFGMSVTGAFATSAGHVVLTNDQVCAALAHLVVRGRLATMDVKEALKLIYPADTAEQPLVTTADVFAVRAFDIALAAYLLNSTVSSYTYAGLAEAFLGGVPEERDSVVDEVAQNAAMARLLVGKLASAMADDASERVYDEVDMPLVPVLLEMERTGVEVDVERLSVLRDAAAAELESLAGEIYGIAGEEFNIDSPKQLGHVLFEMMGLEPLKKNRRGYSTDATVLRELAKTEPIASLVIRYREVSKIKGTYIDSLPKMRSADRRIHTVFHQTVTATGRLSSSDPNLQNIPVRTDFGRQIRECFVPLREGDVFLSADYSQIELRLLAHLSEDEHLIAAFNSGADFHASTAARVFGLDVGEVTPQLRSRAKAVNFGIVYGQQAFGLAQTLDIPRREAQEMIDLYFAAYPRVREFLDDVVKQATETGYAQTMFGRKRHIPDLRSSNRQRAGVGERTAMNHPMQGSAADIIKLAMVEVARRLREEGFASALLLQVHDELDLSVPESEIASVSQMLADVMENIVNLSVPLSVDVSYGPNWAKAH